MFEVFDNGGKTLDRYTIMMMDWDGKAWQYTGDYIACDTPTTFWQHGHGLKRPPHDPKISVLELPESTQRALLSELEHSND